ncbi:MAG TPA: hypothetical protein VGX28_02620 [Frankiaceae bacterium]|jgi:hypothetical protein|nr:hypothetical protein [Frankiaceae bacterium]
MRTHVPAPHRSLVVAGLLALAGVLGYVLAEVLRAVGERIVSQPWG